MTVKRYELTSAAIPKLSEGGAEVVYKCLEPYGKRDSLNELIDEAEKRHLSAHFKRRDSTTVRESIQHHLRHFIKEGIVRVAASIWAGMERHSGEPRPAGASPH